MMPLHVPTTSPTRDVEASTAVLTLTPSCVITGPLRFSGEPATVCQILLRIGKPGQSPASLETRLMLTMMPSSNDVARAVGFILDRCSRNDGMVQGSDFAYGNGNFQIQIRNAQHCGSLYR